MNSKLWRSFRVIDSSKKKSVWKFLTKIIIKVIHVIWYRDGFVKLGFLFEQILVI